MKHIHSVSIVVPTLNEVDNIDLLLSSILSQPAPNIMLEILVADGGSTDGTRERVQAWEAKSPVRLIRGDGTHGLAGDVLTATRCANGGIVVVMDADLSHPPDRIPDLIKPIMDGSFDMMVGSRYVPGGATPDWPKSRRLLSRLGGALAWPITELRDPMSGFFAVRKEHLLAVDSDASGFKIGLEVIATGGEHFRVSEIPIIFRDRVLGQSKIGLGQMISYIHRLLALGGGVVSFGTAGRFAGVGLIGLASDILIFQVLFAAGFGLGVSHAVGFAFAAILNYILNSRWAFAPKIAHNQRRDWTRFARFLTVCLLAFSLRGGIIACAVQLFGWPPQVSLILGIGAAAAVNYFGNAFFVFPSPKERASFVIPWRVAAIGVLGYVLLLRLAFLGVVDLIPEEAYYWNYAQHLDIGYLDHPPMVAWLIWLGTSLFGNTEFGVRIGAYVAWIATAIFVFQFSRNLFGKSAALVSVLLVATLPFFFSTGIMMMPDAPLTAAWAGTLYFLERALLGDKRWAWLGAGAWVGFGMLSKYTIVLLGPATLIFLLIDARSRRWLLRPEPYIAFAIAVALFSPVIIWNAMNEWVSFAFQSTRRLDSSTNFSLPALAGSIAVLLTPFGSIAALLAFRRLNFKDKAAENFRRSTFVGVYTIVPLSVFVMFSLFHSVKLNWTGPIWLALIPAIAASIVAATGKASKFDNMVRQLWVPTMASTLVIYGLGLHYLVLGLPMTGYVGTIRTLPVAWQEFGHTVGLVQNEIERATEKPVLLIGMDRYFLASQTAFYNRLDENAVKSSVGSGVVGKNSLMYNYWFEPENLMGSNAILFSLKRHELEQESLTKYFQSLTQVHQREVVKQGVPVGRFYYRIGYQLRNCAVPECR
ncbi:glycosyltransferase family 39 protein [Phyllobacterium sp. YR531]|uniref:glycosyltransferase family 39 protein n=1 Tax=Phyllobacterium sp. YR531 TaxID=1144343 RepID=UPI00059473FF|nr:glycosyltransferase family 39 protein [Phyllobacterium sp. YR531]